MKISKSELLALGPCYPEERVGVRIAGDVKATPLLAFAASVSVEDFLWVLRQMNHAGRTPPPRIDVSDQCEEGQ